MKINKRIIFIILIILCFNIFLVPFCFADVPNIESGAAILIEKNTGKILYDKNANKRMYPASTTKIMTAILTLENCKLSDVATVSETAISTIPNGYVTVNIQIGEELTIKDLLYALMVKSANDAAVVLAEHISGSVENFSDLINKKAKELGCKDTHFVNPNGIHNENHYSTAYDLALIAQYCMNNEIFRKVVSTTSYTLPATNKYDSADRTFSNTNSLIIVNNNNRADNYYYKNAIGIKTGFTSQAKNCLIAGSLRDGLEFISVILYAGLNSNGLSQRYLDTINLFDYGYNNFTLTKVKEPNNVIDTVEVKKATRETKSLDLLIEDEITVVNNKETDINSIIPAIELNGELIAPISKGQIVGKITYDVDGISYSSNLLASHDVEKSNFATVIIIIVFAILICIIFYPHFRDKNRKNKRNKNNFRNKSKRKNDNLYSFL